MSRIEEVASRTGAEIARAYASGEARPSDVVEALLSRIEASPEQAAFISVLADRARSEAHSADRRYAEGRPRSALDGVPLAWKDLIDIAGERTTAGSKLLSSRPPARTDAACVAQAAAAGMVTLGKLNLSELAYSGLGLNPHFGTPRNPHSDGAARVPGGSSSGCGVAVAARLTPCAIGTDTGGSIRVPASFTGVVGYKPTWGRIDAEGVFALAPSYDTVGPLARSVEDCVLLGAILRGSARPMAQPPPPQDITVVAATNVVSEALDAATAENFELTLARLSAAGVSIRREHVEALDDVRRVTLIHGTLTAAEAYIQHRTLVDGPDASQMDRRVLKRILAGKAMRASDVLAIRQVGRSAAEALQRQLAGALLVHPTTPTVAPQIAPLEADDEMFHRINLLTLRNTMLGNVLDLCAIAMPNGCDPLGCPTSLLLSAPAGRDEQLLSAALSLEATVAAPAQSDARSRAASFADPSGPEFKTRRHR